MAGTAIIGTGTWGTAMACLIARGGQEVVLWGRDPEKVARIAHQRRHPHLDGQRLPPGVRPVSETEALEAADLILWAVPTQHSADIARRLAPELPPAVPVVSLSKGLEQGSHRRVCELLEAELGLRPYGCLSGPSHAEEVVAELPVALVAAGPEALRELLVERVAARHLRLYLSEDLVGVELGGALKNVIAIAAGICDGLHLGDNAKAALVTRGVAEMRRIGRAVGANDATFAGLAGIGDLLATCYSPHGRNRALGLAIAQGETVEDHLARTGMVAEGAHTSRAAVELGRHHGVEVPIASQVASVVWDGKDVATAIDELLTRAAKDEDA